ncbi:MAG: DUF177 domain-containing protein [Nitrospinota bacterium]
MKNNPSDLWIDISDIPEKGLNLELMKDASFFETEEADFRVTKPVSIHCDITKVGDEIYVRGKISFTIETNCSRCLASFTLSADQEFKVTYLPATMRPSDEEIGLRRSDMHVSCYSNNRLDIILPVRDQIVLAVPIKTLCAPACAGLCSVCGQNLNIKKCCCYKSEEIDPGLSILKELKFRKNR